MNVLELAEQNFIIAFAIVVGIGLLQGIIMGKGIRSRFPSLKKHARMASIILLILFAINAVFNAGLTAVIGIFVSITLIIFLKFADIHQIPRYFIFVISCIVLIVALLGKFTDFVPTTFQILIYAFYQSGITLGIFLITRRKESNVLSELK